MLLQGSLYLCRIYSSVVQVDQAAETGQDEAMIVRLQSDRIIQHVDKLQPSELTQGADLC